MSDLTYYTVLTDAGITYEAECLASETEFHITQIAIGDGGGSEITPDTAMTELVNEVARYDVSGEELDTDEGLYYAKITIPAEDGGFTIRELGGYNSDGTLVMVANFPETVKNTQDTGDLRTMYIRMDLSIVNAETYPTSVDSSLAYPSTQYVDNLYQELLELDENNVKLTGDQTVNGVKTFNETIEGNCATASQLETPRTIELTGAVEGSTSFDGSSAVSITTTIGSTYNESGLETLFTAMMPDWDNPSNLLSANVTYTANVAGWVRWNVDENDTSRVLYINGCVVAKARATGSHDGSGTGALLPLAPGDTFKVTKRTDLYFYPLRCAVAASSLVSS